MVIKSRALASRTQQDGKEALLDVAVVEHLALAPSEGEDHRGRFPLALGTLGIVPSTCICRVTKRIHPKSVKQS